MRLEAKGVGWSAGGSVIIDGIDVTAVPGHVLGLLGPNGAGKSTLMNVLARLVEPDRGELSLDGRDYSQWGRREMARTLVAVQQQATTDQDVLVEDVIDLGRIPHRSHWAGVSGHDRRVVRRAARATRVEHLLERHWWTLSGGEQQRVQIARAFAQEGRIMLLDEPTNHLDIAHQLDVLDRVRATGLTVVVALHDLNLAAAYCDEVLVLEGGRAVHYGPPAQVLTAEVVREVYKVEVRVLHPEPGGPPLFQYLRSGIAPAGESASGGETPGEEGENSWDTAGRS
ncbi:ABC transporter ATP-binding protein [uncultured Propionibacterium sp.]|uniref:ABC transporter ATP-binding protein n=1 Tax=uncultured Propionibacterium sp. TaxID=218066 RepID=UPI002930D88F|nr:ABC transporter ATP-binding protein [uncultured Propionibacterium sp.]